MSDLDRIEALLDRGLLPTVEEQKLLKLGSKELARRWVSGMHKEAERARQQENAEWRKYFDLHSRQRGAGADWDRFIAEGSDKAHALFNVVEQYAEAAWMAHLEAVFRRVPGAPPAAFRDFFHHAPSALFPEHRPGYWHHPEYYLRSASGPGQHWFGLLRSKFLSDSRTFIPDAGELIVMNTGCGGAEGVSIKHDSRDVLVTVTGVLGPWNFDPSSKTVEFEPGSSSVQVQLAYRKGVPCLADLLWDMVRLDRILEARSGLGQNGEAYRVDGRKPVPFHRHAT
jgi:hypothetical protein